MVLQKFQKNSAESWKYICRDMGKSLLNFSDNSAECLEIMMQKYGNVLQNLEQYCRILVIMLQNIGNRTAELPKYWISTGVRREGTVTSSVPQYWRN